MGRPKSKKSRRSFSNLGLTPEEDDKLIGLLREKDLSLRQVNRALIRQWINEGGQGVLKYSKY